MSDIIDISHTLSPAIAVWPGDTPFNTFPVMSMDDGAAVNVGSVTMSVHCGTHADAPYHYIPDGKTIDQCDLTPFIGKALVIDALDVDCIMPEHLERAVGGEVTRLLFKTNTAKPDRFSGDFAYVSEEGARAIAESGVVLIGIDTPSVDHPDSKTLSAHRIFGENGIFILENLNLTHVRPGLYELIALPLKLRGMDGSPVRAVLRSL